MGKLEEIKLLQGYLVKFSEKTQNRPYLDPENMRKIEREVNRIEREKKLKRVLNI